VSVPETFWKYIRDMYERAEAGAPDGKQPLVEVVTVDGNTFAPGVVQAFDPFLVCEIVSPDGTTGVLAVRPDRIIEVRIRYVPVGGNQVGFSLGEVVGG
jgi:hypothetical protein